MHPTARLLSARAHQPLIRFGRRSQPSKAAQAHPAAPPELKKSFAGFVQRQDAQNLKAPATAQVASPSVAKNVYRYYWEAPERYWKNELEEHEIQSIESGGASLR